MTKTKVVVCVRSDFERHHWWHPALGAWLLSLMAETTYKMFVELITGAGGYAASANVAAITFMDPIYDDAEWFCMVDNDTAPPMNILRMLDDVPDYVDVLAPLCFMARDYTSLPMAGNFIPTIEDGKTVYKFEHIDLAGKPTIYEVDRCGGGFWFVRRKVFLAMQKPYFKVLYDGDTQYMTVSDDVYFQMRAKELGFRVFCDTRFVASHYHTTDLSVSVHHV